MKTLIFLSMVFAVVTSIGITDQGNASVSNRDKVVALLNSIETGDPGSVEYIKPGQVHPAQSHGR
jgi:hypothetical protein